jgi:hypothetical protein
MLFYNTSRHNELLPLQGYRLICLFRLQENASSHLPMGRPTYSHVYQWLKTGFGLVIWFIDHLQVVTTSNYNTAADLHNL